MSSSLSLVEFYGQFIHITRSRYKPSRRSYFDIRDKDLVNNIKKLHSQSVPIEAISKYYDMTEQENVEWIDHSKTFDHFFNLTSKESPELKESRAPKVESKLKPSNPAVEVFAYYARVVDCKNSRMTASKAELRLITERLKTNSADKLKMAIDGAYSNDYYRQKGMPLNLIFNSCSRVHELTMISRNISPKVMSVSERRKTNIELALQDIRGRSNYEAQHDGIIYDHQPECHLEDLQNK